MDERQWTAFRRRLRTRVNAQMALIIGPVALVGVIVWVVTAPVYPSGDIRSETLFRLAIGGLFGVG